MLQSLRDGAQSKAIKVLVFFIILSFAGFGLESLLPGGSGTSVAEVNGTEISPQSLQQAIDGQKRQLAQIFGENLDPTLLDDDRLRPRALQSLIDRELLLQASRNLGLTATDRAIGTVITNVEAFKIDGRFSPEQYKVVLANAGVTPERFRRAQADEIVISQLESAILNSDFTTSTEMAAAANIVTEERDVRYLLVERREIEEQAAISSDDVTAYYKSNREEFVTDEQVIAEYIELTAEDFFTDVDADELAEQFEAVKNEYEVSEQARVSHILLVQGDGEADSQLALRINEVASQLEFGADFSELAQQLSDDIGSASLGGELGFTDGTAFPEAMEAVIAELEVGEISAAVETDAGTHFIRLDERIAAESADFNALRAELEASIQRSNAEQELLSAVDALRDLSFNSVDLKGPAEALAVDAKLSGPISPSQGESIFASAAVRSTLFSEEIYEAGNNSEVLELAENRFVVVRVDQKIPSVQKPLSDVDESIRRRLQEEAITARLKVLLADTQARMQSGDTLEAIATAQGWQWRVELDARRSGSLLPPEIAEAAFAIRFTDGVDLVHVTLPGGQFAIVELADVTSGSTDKLSTPERESMAEQLATVKGQLSLVEYRRALRNSSDIVTR